MGYEELGGPFKLDLQVSALNNFVNIHLIEMITVEDE